MAALVLEKKSVTNQNSGNQTEKPPEVWFDNVDPLLLDSQNDVLPNETELKIEGGTDGYYTLIF